MQNVRVSVQNITFLYIPCTGVCTTSFAWRGIRFFILSFETIVSFCGALWIHYQCRIKKKPWISYSQNLYAKIRLFLSKTCIFYHNRYKYYTPIVHTVSLSITDHVSIVCTWHRLTSATQRIVSVLSAESRVLFYPRCVNIVYRAWSFVDLAYTHTPRKDEGLRHTQIQTYV